MAIQYTITAVDGDLIIVEYADTSWTIANFEHNFANFILPAWGCK